MRISRLILTNWKNFLSFDCMLADRVFVIGPNASGKSNILDAIRFLRDIAASEGGGLQSAISKRGGLKLLRCLGAKGVNSDIAVAVELGDAEGRKWTYILEIGGKQHGGKDIRAYIRKESVIDANGNTLLNRSNKDKNERDDPELLTETALEQTSKNRDFRAIVNFFRSIEYLHVVPQIIRDPARALDDGEDPFGGDLLAKINAATDKSRNARLKKMTEALRIAVPNLDSLELEVDARGIPHLRAKYRHWRPQGAWQREEQFSDGTLRLLGLVWMLLDAKGPVLLEEPELSLNNAVVAQLPRLFRRAMRGTRRQAIRQMIVTTHSADLLADQTIGLDEVILLKPGEHGTEGLIGTTIPEIAAMVEGGVGLHEALLPQVNPQNVDDLGKLSFG